MADRKKPEIDSDVVRRAAALLDELGLNELEYGDGAWHVKVVAKSRAPAAAAAPAGEGQAAPAEPERDDFADHPGVVKAPMVGIVYTAPDPDSPPLVRVGDQVTEGQPVLLIEAMKVFNRIKAPRAGKVTRILVSSGTPVEYDEPLLIIE